jgi:hypothetical protein
VPESEDHLVGLPRVNPQLLRNLHVPTP